MNILIHIQVEEEKKKPKCQIVKSQNSLCFQMSSQERNCQIAGLQKPYTKMKADRSQVSWKQELCNEHC